MLNPKNTRTIRHPRQSGRVRLSTLLGGLALGGLALGSAALIGPLQDNLRPAAPVAEVIMPVVEAPAEEPMPVSTIAPQEQIAIVEEAVGPQPIDIDAAPVAGARPVVALAHEDLETDYRALAVGLLDAGDEEAGFIALRKDLFTAEPTVRRLLRLARVGRHIGEYAIAEQALLDAGAIDPSAASVSVEQARLHIATGALDDARDAARAAIRSDGEHSMAWNLAGRVAMLQSEWQRAAVSFRRAAELEPTHPMIQNNLGLLYVKMREPDAAIDALEVALELFEEDVPHFVFNNLGLAYEQAELHEDARDAFEQALIVSPLYARARLNLERVLTTLAQLDEQEAVDNALAAVDIEDDEADVELDDELGVDEAEASGASE